MKRFFLAFGALAASLLSQAPRWASAASIIKDPNPPKYGVEIEPKLNVAFFGITNYGGTGFGPGVRFSIPVMSPGFIKTINNSIAISFGADVMRYEGYRYGYRNYYGFCGKNTNCQLYYNGAYDTSFWALHLPVTMQWNFFLTDKWSVFGEPGVTVRRAFYKEDPYYAQYCDPRFYNCSNGPYGSPWDVYFTFFVGGRFHFSEKVALTMRIGHPIDASIGISFFL